MKKIFFQMEYDVFYVTGQKSGTSEEEDGIDQMEYDAFICYRY